MEHTFLSENERKSKLFESWEDYLNQTELELIRSRILDSYEGIATVSNLSKKFFDLRLEDGRRLRRVPITSKISSYSRIGDSIYLLIGRRELEWRVLEVISVGSLLPSATAKSGSSEHGFHFTVNPAYANSLDKSAVTE